MGKRYNELSSNETISFPSTLYASNNERYSHKGSDYNKIWTENVFQSTGNLVTDQQ